MMLRQERKENVEGIRCVRVETSAFSESAGYLLTELAESIRLRVGGRKMLETLEWNVERSRFSACWIPQSEPRCPSILPKTFLSFFLLSPPFFFFLLDSNTHNSFQFFQFSFLLENCTTVNTKKYQVEGFIYDISTKLKIVPGSLTVLSNSFEGHKMKKWEKEVSFDRGNCLRIFNVEIW